VGYVWDEAKAAENLRKHGPAFEAVHDLDWSPGLYDEDWAPYGEQRFVVVAPIGDQLVVLVFTETENEVDVRVISLRPATAHEIRR